MGSSSSDGSLVAGFILFAILAAIYILPGIVASSRKHPQAGAIWVLNICLGWTLVGWVAALVWACTNSQRVRVENPAVVTSVAPPSRPASTTDELERLAALRDRGVLSENEFADQKRRLLGAA